jgi:hypothetical protein
MHKLDKCLPNDCSNIIASKFTLVFGRELVRDNNPRHLIGSKSPKVRFILAIWITLKPNLLNLSKLSTQEYSYLALVVNPVAIYVHISNPNIGCPLLILLDGWHYVIRGNRTYLRKSSPVTVNSSLR